MKPLIKFNSIVLTITTIVVFGIWLLFNFLKIDNPYIVLITSGFVSFGIYRLLVKAFLWLFSKWRNFKKWILGP